MLSPTPPARTVTADVVLGADLPSFSGATLRARLEDVTYADRPATALDERVVRDVAHRAGAEQRVHVVFDASGADPSAHYTVAAHLARHDGEDIRPGDYLTVESYPVLTSGHPSRI